MKAKSFFEIVKLNKSDNRYRLYIGLNLNGSDVSDLAIPGGENPDDYHVTLLYGYFEHKGDEDDTAVRIQTALEEIKDDIPDRVAFLHEQRFEASESSDKKDVIVARAEGGYLEKVHSELLKELKNNGINVETTFTEYIPHMTLAYIEPGAEYKLRELDHSAAVKDISIDVERKDSKTHENEFKMNKSDSDIDKFNPYHDSLGRFTTSGGGASFSGTLLHGSPNKGIKEFDINRAGSNTGSGEKLLFFTNDKQMADDFSYERLPGSSKFMNVKGKKGEVYRTKVKMKKPLDFRNLSDDDIKAIKELDADGILTDSNIKMMAGMKNHGSLKAALDLRPETLKRLGYDGIIANTDNGKTEFAVVDSKQTKIIHKSFSEILKSSKQVSLVERWKNDKNPFKILYIPDDVEKFNPYHDRLGRFSTGDGAASFTWRPGASADHDNAIAREKERMASVGSSQQKEEQTGRGHIPLKSYDDSLNTVKQELGCNDKQAKKYINSVASYTSENYTAIRAYQTGKKNDYTKKFSRDAKTVEDYIEKAPNWNGGTLYRGINVESGDVKSLFKPGTELDMQGTSSWSSDKGVSETFTWGSGTKVIFQCDKISKATSITHISNSPSEKEVLVSKDTKYVTKKISKKGKYYYVYLDEVTGMAKSFSNILKFNPYHDRLGRFTSGNGGSATFMTIQTRDPKKQHMADKAIARAKEQSSSGEKKTETHINGSKKNEMSNSAAMDEVMKMPIDYEPYQRGQISRIDAGQLYKAVKNGNVKALPETVKHMYDCTEDYIKFANERYTQNYVFYDNVQYMTRSLLNGKYKVAQHFINSIEDDLISRAGKKSRFYKYQTQKSFSKPEVETLNKADTEFHLNPPFNITKADEDKRLVFGWALVSADKYGNELIDRQGDMVDPDDLEDGAYEYVLNFRDAGEEHIGTLRKKARMVESCVFTPEKMKAIGIPEGTIPVGWWIGFYVDDDRTWELIKSGHYKMFSIEGKAVREPIEDSQPHSMEKSLAKQVAKSFNEILDRKS